MNPKLPKKRSFGFTLVELLVAVSIISILAVIGSVVYSNISKGARDSKRKADVEAISKAYEGHFDASINAYAVYDPTWFASGEPMDPRNTDYYNVQAADFSGYKVCAALNNHPSDTCNSNSSTCYCLNSQQGSINLSSPPTGSGSEFGWGGSGLQHPASCDPSGVLDDGLLGYWKMDEVSWNGTPGEVKDLAGSNNGTAGISASIFSPGKSGRAGLFADGGITSNENIEIPESSILKPTNGFTISFWVYPTTVTGTGNPTDPPTAGTWRGIITGAGGSGYSQGSWRVLDINNGVYLQINFVQNNPPVTCNTGLNSLSRNSWHLVTATYDLQNLKVFIDGTHLTPSTPSCTVAATSPVNYLSGPMHLGYSQVGYAGNVDDVRLYSPPLSSSQLSSIWSAGSGCFP